MEQTQGITYRYMANLLKKLDKTPVEVLPGYCDGLVLPLGTKISIVDSIEDIRPLCTDFDKSKLFVSFMVYEQDTDNLMCEIIWKTSGRYVYKNNQKFENPPQFDEIFTKVRGIFKEHLANSIKNNAPDVKTDIHFYRRQNMILRYLMREQKQN